MQVRMRGWVDGRLKERLEEVFDDVFEARDLVVQLVDVVQPRDLDQPQRIVRVYLGFCEASLRGKNNLAKKVTPCLTQPNWPACPIHGWIDLMLRMINSNYGSFLRQTID